MSIITTFEDQCRALTSVASADENASRFLVGTQCLKKENLLYLFEYKSDNNNLARVSFKFPYGELWHLSTSSKYPDLMTAVVAQEDGQLEASLFRLPKELENPIEDDYGLSESPIKKIFDLTMENSSNMTPQCHWHPDEGDQLLTCNDGNIEFWDINEQKQVQDYSILEALEKSGRLEAGAKMQKVADLKWSSLFNCSVVAAAIGSTICGIDTRIPNNSPSSICWLIEDSRCNRTRSIDFNPNSQYYLASGGDDCRAKFWDLRQTAQAALQLQAHTHWIWSIRYNPFHDQLVLSAGSDARVTLMRAQSIASEPFGQLAEEDDDDEDNNDDGIDKSSLDEETAEDVESEVKETKQLQDEVINVYEEHDDSVYAIEWASDPWLFASLGYESRLVINKVPKAEKFNILF